MDKKLKHLEMIQAVISRMAANSFLLKGWSVTLTAAVFALAGSKNDNAFLVLIALLPVVMFWGLDGYFLRQEKLFRKLYDYVRSLDEAEIDFSMDTSSFQGAVDTELKIITSGTLLKFHLPVTVIVLVVFCLS